MAYYRQDLRKQWWYYFGRDGAEARMRAAIRVCDICGDRFPTRVSQPSNYCSKSCRGSASAKTRGLGPAEKAPQWKGGKSRNRGYVKIYDPRPDRVTKYVLEHRLVMENHLGRELRSDEVVHHINGIKDDNRIENLNLTTRSEHFRSHWTFS